MAAAIQPKIPVAENSPEKLCERCLQRKPVSEFRRRRRGGVARMGDCNWCHNRRERQRLAAARAAEEQTALDRFARALKNTPDSGPGHERVLWLCDTIFRYFGGVAGFASAWVAYFEAAKAANPENKRCADFFSACIRLAGCADAARRAERAECDHFLEAMSDEDLEAALMAVARKLIRSQPELAVVAAQQLGWHIVPMENVGTSFVS